MLEQAIGSRGSSPEAVGLDPRLGRLSEVSRMIAHVSHDLRHPLTAILANAEFLTRSDLSENDRKDLYYEIRCAIDRMGELISSLLECSAGNQKLRYRAHNIVDTVERVIRMTTARSEYRSVIIVHRHQGVPVGWFDPARLECVLVNLVLNACEAVSPDSGQVVITTCAAGATLEMRVWDNGPGIPKEIQPTIFEPFVSYGKAEGRGLGLAIAKKIIEDHGGEISLDRKNKTGTLFRITMPFAIPQGAMAAYSVG
jgi:signal transduction histidine kinase